MAGPVARDDGPVVRRGGGADGRFGLSLLAVMAVVFTTATVTTYIVLCVFSTAATERVHLGPVERYGEVLSGALIAAVGVAFLVWTR
jgi:hypothetical protein